VADALLARLRRWDIGPVLPGFLLDPDLAPELSRRAHAEADYRQLAALRAKYDPTDLLRINHTMPPEL
jgi:hypothetical protein